jgi:hypothetical protein
MWRLGLRAAVAGTCLAALALGMEPAAASSPGSWGTAREIPGLAALTDGNGVYVTAVSCPKAGNCGAGGAYVDKTAHLQGFVVSEQNGVWGKALEVPGLGALNVNGYAEVTSVSCPSAGNCAAGGYYDSSARAYQAFVVSERNGVWDSASVVRGLPTVGGAQLWSVSCSSAGGCGAGGDYVDKAGHQQGFVVSEQNSIWGKAREVPGIAALGPYSFLDNVSCPSPGACGAEGIYWGVGSFNHGFVITERNGVWGKAQKIPGIRALSAGGYANLQAVSCSSAGNCAAGGESISLSGAERAFVVSERDGVWGKALQVPGLGALGPHGYSNVTSVSCPSLGNCVVGGGYVRQSGGAHGFVFGQHLGKWGTALTLQGFSNAAVNSVSCSAAGDCAAGGYYDTSPGRQGFVANETNGIWGKELQVPGLATLNTGGDASVTRVSCPSLGHCSAVGYYTDSSGAYQNHGFVAGQH